MSLGPTEFSLSYDLCCPPLSLSALLSIPHSYSLSYSMPSHLSLISYRVASDIYFSTRPTVALFFSFSSFPLLSLTHPSSLLTQIAWLFSFPFPFLISFMPSDSHLYYNKPEAHLLATSTLLLILSIVKDWSFFNRWFSPMSFCS